MRLQRKKHIVVVFQIKIFFGKNEGLLFSKLIFFLNGNTIVGLPQKQGSEG